MGNECGGCGKRGEGFKKCTKCKVTYYCSRECQVKDWKSGHKQLCKLLSRQRWEMKEWKKEMKEWETSRLIDVGNEPQAGIEQRLAACSLLTDKPLARETIASIHGVLGDLYWNRPGGAKEENMEAAIASYTVALTALSPDVKSQAFAWASRNFNLGLAHFASTAGDRSENIEAALECYAKALSVFTQEADAENYACAQMNLGVAYASRMAGDVAENVEAAIRSYFAALQVWTEESAPANWASVKANLGNAFLSRVRGSAEGNVEASIECYKEATRVRTMDADKVAWAGLQAKLASAYAVRVRGRPADNIEVVVRCCKVALEYRPFGVDREGWVESQILLGKALLLRASEDPVEDAKAAADALMSALAAWDILKWNKEGSDTWASVQMALGNAHAKLISREGGAAKNASLSAFQAAIGVWRVEVNPVAHVMLCSRIVTVLATGVEDGSSGDGDGNGNAVAFARNALTTLLAVSKAVADSPLTRRLFFSQFESLVDGCISLLVAAGSVEEAYKVASAAKDRAQTGMTEESVAVAGLDEAGMTEYQYRVRQVSGQTADGEGFSKAWSAIAEFASRVGGGEASVGGGGGVEVGEGEVVVEWMFLKTFHRWVVFVVGEGGVRVIEMEEHDSVGAAEALEAFLEAGDVETAGQVCVGAGVGRVVGVLGEMYGGAGEAGGEKVNVCLVPHMWLSQIPLHSVAVQVGEGGDVRRMMDEAWFGGVRYGMSMSMLEKGKGARTRAGVEGSADVGATVVLVAPPEVAESEEVRGAWEEGSVTVPEGMTLDCVNEALANVGGPCTVVFAVEVEGKEGGGGIVLSEDVSVSCDQILGGDLNVVEGSTVVLMSRSTGVIESLIWGGAGRVVAPFVRVGGVEEVVRGGAGVGVWG